MGNGCLSSDLRADWFRCEMFRHNNMMFIKLYIFVELERFRFICLTDHFSSN